MVVGWFRLGTASCEPSTATRGCNHELSEGLEDWADERTMTRMLMSSGGRSMKSVWYVKNGFEISSERL